MKFEKSTFVKFKFVTILACHVPHILLLLARNCANLGNVYRLSVAELTFLKLSLVTGIALVVKLIANTFIFFFSCTNSESVLKFFILLYGMDILSGTVIFTDSFIRNEIWNRGRKELQTGFAVEVAYLVLILLMVLIEICCIFVYRKCLQIGHFRRRRVSDALRKYLKEPLHLTMH